LQKACNPDMADHTTHRTKPALASSPPARRSTSHVSNSAAPLDTPHSALVAGADTPQPAALGNYQLRVSRA